MSLTLKELFGKVHNQDLNERIAAACWRYSKELVKKLTPSIKELNLAKRLLSDDGMGKDIGIFQIAVVVLIDDAEITDESIQTAVNQIGTKFIELEAS